MDFNKETPKTKSLQEFKDKVEKVMTMKELGMLTEEDLEKLKRKLLAEISED